MTFLDRCLRRLGIRPQPTDREPVSPELRPEPSGLVAAPVPSPPAGRQPVDVPHLEVAAVPSDRCPGGPVVAVAALGPRQTHDTNVCATPVVHQAPPAGHDRTPCCGRTLFELPLQDRVVRNPTRATCTGATP